MMFRTTQFARLKTTTAAAAISVASAGLMLSQPANAQADEAGEVAQAARPATTIIVTGSRIARPDLDTTSPVSIVSSEEFALQQTVNVEEVLNDMPQVIPSSTGASNNPGDGVATVDLRGLGEERTLVLVNGRRYISYDADQIVDLNTIPAALIERVDVVTGGASAVYGSDAIAGVVNFILKDDFEGLEVNVSQELSEEADGRRTNLSATMGTNFADYRGNIVAHLGYYNRQGVFAGAREATEFSVSDPGGGAPLFPGGSSLIPSFRFTVPGLAQALGLGTTANTAVRFDEDGNAIRYNSTTDLYNFGPDNYLQVPQERFLGFAKATYEVNEHVVPYLEAVFVNNRVSSELAPTPISNGTAFRGGALGSNLEVHVYSPFIGAAARSALQALDTDGDGYVASGAYGRRFLETGTRINDDDRNAYRFLGGVKGDIVGDWAYDAYYSYARTRNTTVQTGNVQLSALLSGLRTAFDNPATSVVESSPTPFPGVPGGGNLVCADASARAAGCVPVNVFGANNISPEAADYIAVSATNLEEAETQVASAVITNPDLFDFGAGGVGVALGVEHRREFASYQPDTFLASGDVGGFNAGEPTSGGYNVTEFFGEVNIPILADRPFFQRLEVNGAVRYSDYSNAVGGVFTYAAGAQWEPVYGLTLRGNYQRAIRGPNVNELFEGQTLDFAGAVDPCQNPALAVGEVRQRCIDSGVPAGVVGTNYGSGSTSFAGLVGGNPDLTEERAKTWTVGAAFVPSFFDQLSLTVDYYNIEIEDYIGTVGNQNIANGCLLQGITSLCSQFSRSPTGEFEQFINFNLNAASLKTEGVDVGARLNVPLGFGLGQDGDGRLTMDFKGSYLITLDYAAIPGLTLIECAGKFGRICSDTVAFGPTPHWRHALRTTYREGGAFLSLLWRYIGPSSDEDPNFVYAVERLDPVSYFDLTAGAEITENVSIAFGVDNLFNKGFQPIASPQQGGNGQQSNTFPTTYDVLGRYYTLSASFRF